MKPKLSYTIWFSQRTGSTLLCRALQSTGLAGKPSEWLNASDLLGKYQLDNYLLTECERKAPGFRHGDTKARSLPHVARGWLGNFY
ncbi:Stf0 family sulfotransferase [Pleurocapsa sp. PCC 7319]|uniref:Stf0 family sulfotransferase n=1 Tax=Pleurocapsa sp. PCC 7319 TaxID=118161 RepID=UPI00036248F2